MLNTLFPDVEPYNTFTFEVSGVHTLYVEEVGNPKGQPVIFLHGGPGAGLSKRHRRFLIRLITVSSSSISAGRVRAFRTRISKRTRRGI